MATAFMYPDEDEAGRRKKGKAAETAAFSQRRLREARSVLRHSRAKAEAAALNAKKDRLRNEARAE
jgi:hypothetical protein